MYDLPQKKLIEVALLFASALVAAAWDVRGRPNKRLQPTWLIGAFFQVLTRIAVSFLATVLTTHPPSG